MIPRLVLIWSLLLYTRVCAEGFTFPNGDQYIFIVGDIVNITWDIVTPRLNLCEVCNATLCFLNNVSNTYSYLWPASRTIYRESGCVFELQPLGVNGVSVPPNITSDLFAVNKRYTDDPSPTLYNGYSTSTSTISTTSTATSSPTPTTAPQQTQPAAPAAATTTSTPHHISTATRVGLGVGIPLAALLALTWLYFLLPAHKRPVLVWPARSQHAPDGNSPTMTEKAEQGRRGGVGHVRDTSDVSAMTESTAVDTAGPARDLEGGRGRISELMGSPRSELEAGRVDR